MLILIIVSMFSQAHAQTPYFIHHKVLKGKRGYLSQAIFQDHLGFVWFGTTDGLILYDGTDYIQFTEADGMAGTSVTAICEDSVGSFWIGHGNGRISRMIGRKFTEFMPDEGLGDVTITDLEVDEKNRVWFSTLGEGVYYYSDNRLYNLNTDDGLADNYAYSIAILGEEVCIGTDYGISIYNAAEKTFDHISMSDGIPDNIVKKVLYDENEILWVGTDEAGIFSIEMRSGKISIIDGWNFGSINDFVVDGQDIWISTDRSGVVELIVDDDGIHRYNHITKKHGLMSDRTNSIFIDREKNLWIGTRDEVTQSVTSVFEFLDDRHGLPSRMMVYDFLIDENEFYWVCSDQGFFKLSESEDGGFRIDNLFEGTPLENITFISLYEDYQNYLWAGTYDHGVFRIDPATLSYRQYNVENGLCDNNVISITANEQHILFSTLGGGVSMCDINADQITFRNLTKTFPEIANYVYGTLIDSEDRIWFAQDADRLSYFLNDSIYSFGPKDSLYISTIYSLIEDSQKNIWFTTASEGLYCYDGEDFINYNENTGLASDEIQSIANDPYGNLVIVSNEGIDIFNPVNKKFYHFGDNYGTSYRDPQLNSIYQHSNGEIWIGTGNGLIKYKPHVLFRDSIQPLLFLTDIELLSQPIKYGRDRFSYKQNHFTFRFTGIWYQDPDRIRYRSKLEGWDLEWSSPTPTRDRTYSKLPQGDYHFRVEVSLDNSIWTSSADSSYSITIRPPFWRTWWFISTSIIAILLGILTVFRIRLATLRRQKEELESEVEKATQEILNKNAILENQKNEIQAQRDLVMDQHDQIARQQEELQSSIRYAHRIQTAVRTPMHIIQQLLPECFILDKPRDIVSGDFYWVAEKDDHVFIAVADSTGHGVPGAFMSMLGVSGFNEILSSSDCGLKSDGFLNRLRDHVKKALHHTGQEGDAMDGMDVSLVILDKKNMKISFTGANNPLYIIRDEELIEYKGDKRPIGWHTMDKEPFTENVIDIRKGDCIYLFSDGYADQFGGKDGKKFMYKRFKELLVSIHRKKMKEQMSILDRTLVDWTGDQEQIDDVMVVGICL